MIGVFDSGYGGLTILRALRRRLPIQKFAYLGDHKSAPYGQRSAEELFELTTRNVAWLFQHDCRLVVLACNTASSVLRRIQREWLPTHYPTNRILGVIVPTVEEITGVSWNDANILEKPNMKVTTIGLFATSATVSSGVYRAEIMKRMPNARVVQQACPALVPAIEAGMTRMEIAPLVRGCVTELIAKLGSDRLEAVILGCTHYYLIAPVFYEHLHGSYRVVSQIDTVSRSLATYLLRHPEFVSTTKEGEIQLFTTANPDEINAGMPQSLEIPAIFEHVADI